MKQLIIISLCFLLLLSACSKPKENPNKIAFDKLNKDWQECFTKEGNLTKQLFVDMNYENEKELNRLKIETAWALTDCRTKTQSFIQFLEDNRGEFVKNDANLYYSISGTLKSYLNVLDKWDEQMKKLEDLIKNSK
jgi:hypothetical protein